MPGDLVYDPYFRQFTFVCALTLPTNPSLAVLIVFSGVGSAPVLKEDARKVLINRDSQFLKVIVHLRKLLGLDKTDSLVSKRTKQST